MTNRTRASAGQVLVGAIVLLLVLLILVPAMVLYVRHESRWTAKQEKSTAAFHLAEAATERGYWKISQSTVPTTIIPLAGYSFDASYSDVPGGSYAVSIGSDANKNIIVTGVGRDALKRETRAIQAVYQTSSPISSALYSFDENEVQGSGAVEWGPMYSQTQINMGGTPLTYPRLFSPGTISGYCPNCASTPPCTDSVHYWACGCASYVPPVVPNFAYYKALAQSYGAAPAHCNTDGSGNNPSYYRANDGNFKGCTDTSGKVYYVENGKITFSAGGGGSFVVGTIIAVGGQGLQVSGSAGGGSYTAAVPPNAWKEYGLNSTTWAHYKTFDPAAPANFPGLSSTYQSAASYPLTNVLVHGFLYSDGQLEFQGSGNTVLHGAFHTASEINVNANITVYYDANLLVVTQGKSSYTRVSWKELPGQGWPAGLP